MRFRLLWILPAFLASALVRPVWTADASPEGVEFFEKKIRPVLVEQCFKCHTGAKPKGKLRLDSRAGLLQGGDTGPAIVPGQPDKSLLLTAIRYTSDDLRMPQKSKLPDQVIADFATWIKMGAPWPEKGGTGPAVAKDFDLQKRKEFWCWQPVRVPTLPDVRRRDWVRTPVDRFILAGLDAAGIDPARDADRRALVRRVTYDLIGLPPTAQEVESALSDQSAQWYEKVVDRLLDSPHYGERWGRHWLDLVRFGETYGHEFDFEIRDAYHYRDYVIRAFNADVPCCPNRVAIPPSASTSRSSAPASGSWAKPSTRRWTRAWTRPTAAITRSTSSPRRSSA
jgi:hypothetical protein